MVPPSTLVRRNITGVSIDAGLEIYGKRLGLLVEAVPKLSSVSSLLENRVTPCSLLALAGENLVLRLPAAVSSLVMARDETFRLVTYANALSNFSKGG